MRTIHTAVITGPTGAIGQALCSCLLREGIRVYAVCRPDSPRAAELPKTQGLIPLSCDLSNLASLPRMIPDGADAFFHLAWNHTAGPGRNDMPAQIKNIQYTIDACRAAKELGCAVFIGAGSQAEYGRVSVPLTPETPCFPENGYGMAKLCAGQMSRAECRRLDVAHIWPRILSVYGPHDGAGSMIMTVIRKLLNGERPSLTAGEQLWDYLFSEDAARALYALARSGRDGAIYPLGSGKARPLREYVEILRDAIDPALPLGFGEIPYGPGQVMHLEADISALEADADFVQNTDFLTGITQTIHWIRKQKDGKEQENGKKNRP